MANYKQITKSERQELFILKKKGYSNWDIWKALWRSTSTIWREIKRNSIVVDWKWRNPEWDLKYIPDKANHKKYVRRKYCKIYLKKITWDIEKYIIKKLKIYWSPEQISWRWNEENPERMISHVLTYNYVYSARWNKYHKYLYQKRHTKRKRKWKKEKREIIKNRTWIDDRPTIINERKRFWDYEWDLIVSQQWDRSVLLTIIERLSRLLIAKKSDNKKPKEIWKKIRRIQKKIDNMLSLTVDNWIEFWWHENYDCDVYFCHPYSSWEKWQIEYANRLIRRFIPKKSNLSEYSDKQIKRIVDIINNTPRKCLKYKTPIEVYNKNITK